MGARLPFCSRWTFLFFPIFLRFAFAVPELSINPPSLRTPDGDKQVIVCMLYGIDSSQIQDIGWVRRVDGQDQTLVDTPDGKLRTRYLSPLKQEFELTIDPIAVEDSGTYVCKATYEEDGQVKNMQMETQITVSKKIAFADCQAEQHPTNGGEARIVCTLDSYDPNLITWWTREPNSVTAIRKGGDRDYSFEGENKEVLVIPVYDTHVDDGIYVFNAKLKGFTRSGLEQIIQVTGYVPPKIVRKDGDEVLDGLEGRDLVLTCSATGKPVPSYTWFKGGEGGVALTAETPGDKYTVKEGELTIHAYNDDDISTYLCVAQNSVATDKYVVATTIFHKPTISPIANQTTSEGTNVQFACNFDGDGDVNAYWQYMGNRLGFEDAVDNPADYMGVSKIVTRNGNSLVLYINNVQSLDMDEYTCTAENKAGPVSVTTKLFVNRAPMITDFSEEVISWEANKVEIYCVANAVPSPVWTWFNPDGQPVEQDNDHMIVMYDHNQKTVLTVTSRGTEYGEYKCEAKNNVGRAESAIFVKEIRVPLVPTDVASVGGHPTMAKLDISSFRSMDDAETPTQVQFLYATQTQFAGEGFGWDKPDFTTTTILPFDVGSTEYAVVDLSPETIYHMQLRAGNDAGWSQYSDTIQYQTTAARQPETPIFEKGGSGCGDVSCVIEWEEPDAMGSDIVAYKLSYAKVQVSEGGIGESKLLSDYVTVSIDGAGESYELVDLQPNSNYLIKLVATNSVGDGEPASFIIKTTALSSGSMSPGSIVGIVLVVLMIVLVIVDVTCYLVNHCGVLMCICVNCCGKTPPEVKAKEIAMEEGVKSDKTPLQETEPEDKNDTAQENTPMIDNDDKVHTSV